MIFLEDLTYSIVSFCCAESGVVQVRIPQRSFGDTILITAILAADTLSNGIYMLLPTVGCN